MKLVKGLITSDEDENVIMSKDTFYEMDNNFNITLKENKQLKNILTELEEWLKNKQIEYRDNGRKGEAWFSMITLNKIQELKEKYK